MPGDGDIGNESLVFLDVVAEGDLETGRIVFGKTLDDFPVGRNADGEIGGFVAISGFNNGATGGFFGFSGFFFVTAAKTAAD